MAEYRTLIDALNAIDVANGGTGGHAYMIDALNEWAVRLGGTGGHKYTIDALNEIASQEGSTTGFHFDIQELNAISTELGGAGGHTYYIDALNEIVDLSDGGGGGGDVPEELFFSDFVNGVYRLSGGASSLTDLVVFDDADWGTADLSKVIPGSGFKASANSFPRFSDAVQALLLSTGFTIVAEFDYAVGEPGVTNDGTGIDIELYSLDFNQNFFGFIQPTNYNIGDGTSTEPVSEGPGTTNGRYKFGLTVAAGGARIDASFNGNAAHSIVSADTAAFALLHYIGFGVSNTSVDGNYLRSLTGYSPQLAADLPALTA